MPTKISGNGGYSWWTRPIALQAPTNLYFTAASNNSKWRVFQNSSATYDDLDNAPEVDDHNAPSVVARSGKDRWAFATRHNASAVVNKFKASSGINFTDEGNLTHPGDVTYSQICDYADKMIVLSRVSSNTWRFFRTTNWGSSWSSSRQLLGFSGHTGQLYMVTSPSASADTYHVAAYGHPTGSNFHQIVYGRINVNSGNVSDGISTLANLDGTNLPIGVNDLDNIGCTTGTEVVRMFDVGEAHGMPVILYAKWDDVNSVPAGYWMSYKDSSDVWHHVDLGILAGTPFWSPSRYLAGMSIDKNGNNRLVLAREDSGTWYVEKYPILESSGVLSLDTPTLIDSSTGNMLVRPYMVEDGNSVIYQKILHYNDYTDYGMEYWKEDL